MKVALTERSKASVYLRKAEEFCSAASSAQAIDRSDAALLCAVDAGISAADAVCVGLGGRRSLDPDHQRVADLLEEVARDSPDVHARVRQLRSLLQMKNLVEYEARRSTLNESDDATKRCERLVEWARSQLDRARQL